MDYTDIVYSEHDAIATIAIDRPAVMNAFRGRTVEELLHAFSRAGWDKRIAAIVLTGTGDRAFCTGGDQSAHAGQYDGRGTIGIPLEELHSAIRDVPKPVIARVQGYAIGGGNVLATLCDLTIASERAVFGQVGPKVGSVDPGWGTAYLAHVVGEKKAREIWFLCRRYSAQEALAMGLCNTVVAHEKLDDEVAQWGREIVEKSPDRAGHRQALVQRLDRAHPRHRQPRHAGAEPLLRHRRVEGRGARLPRKAQAGVPQVRRGWRAAVDAAGTHGQRSMLLAALLTGAAAAAEVGPAPAAPAMPRERHAAQCVAVLESHAELLAARARAGDAAVLPLLQSRVEAAAAFVGDNYLHGDGDDDHSRALLDAARGEQKTLDPAERTARQTRCADEGAQLLASAGGLQRSVLKRFARRRIDRLLGS